MGAASNLHHSLDRRCVAQFEVGTQYAANEGLWGGLPRDLLSDPGQLRPEFGQWAVMNRACRCGGQCRIGIA